MEAQYQPLLDRPLELKPARRASASKGMGPPGYGQGGMEAGAGAEAVQPETWHWVPQQAIDVTRHAIAQVGTGEQKRRGEAAGNHIKAFKMQRCFHVCAICSIAKISPPAPILRPCRPRQCSPSSTCFWV